MPDFFLYPLFPRLYESILRLPVIRSIRAQERETLNEVFAQNLQATDRVLEVGAGTGYYTFEIARRVRSVAALEHASGMARILRERVVSLETRNIQIVETDFLSYSPAKQFDVVIAIGVLDAIVEWQEFLQRCISQASREVIFTIPRKSLWASLYSFFGGMMGVRVRAYESAEIAQHFNDLHFEFHETGLRTRWTHGLTEVAVVRVMQDERL